MRGIWSVRGLLNPLRHPMVAFQLLSHKVLRWMVPFFLVALFVSNYKLLGNPFYNVVFAAQVVCYGAALAGLVLGFLGMRIRPLAVPVYFCVVNAAALVAFFKTLVRPLAVPVYFCVVNAAALVAFFKTLAGSKTVVWETVRR
jgi:hypothetical protein